MEKYDNSTVRTQSILLEERDALKLLRQGIYGTLSLIERRGDKMAGYGVPLNYVWDRGDYIYIHGATQGHKLDCIEHSPEISFCIVGDVKVLTNIFTTSYESIIVRGEIERVTCHVERVQAIRLLLEKYAPDHVDEGMKYSKKLYDRTEVMRINIQAISGKSGSLV